MLRLIACMLAGQHDYTMGREPGAVFLRCGKCGHRSPGWAVEPSAFPLVAPVNARMRAASARPALAAVAVGQTGARVLPFVRTIAQ